MAKESDNSGEESKRTKVSQAEFPIFTLRLAERIAHAIWDNFAGKGGAPHNVALALDLSPTSGGWRNLCGSSIAYGLTEGGYNATQITLTELGRRIVAPTTEGDDAQAKIEATLQPRILKEFFDRYDRAKFPRDEIAKNVLISMGLPKERVDKALETVKANGEYCGIIQDTKTGPFVALEGFFGKSAGAETQPPVEQVESEDDLPRASTAIEQASERSSSGHSEPNPGPRQLFVAHGKNHKPLDDLKKILNEFKIPYKVAVDEANKGRPISAKVAELMRECSAGIFVFTKDEKFSKSKGDELEEVWRPSENVVYELGAASILWERKIIIVREEGVNFPTDFSDLGYITFRDGEISSKALEILKELVALGLVKFSAA